MRLDRYSNTEGDKGVDDYNSEPVDLTHMRNIIYESDSKDSAPENKLLKYLQVK